MANTFTVNLSPAHAAERICEAVEGGSLTGELIDRYAIGEDEGGLCIVLVFEKHYYRVGNRLTLTVTIDDLAGKTRVHTVGGGGGEGLFGFDWGAADSFEQVAISALDEYRF
ncbi:MAG: hypothetical protein E7654_09130 [Ruminococcaceae bacterium]|nr:hypothetical protein [Oscillospiraceae bacterium]